MHGQVGLRIRHLLTDSRKIKHTEGALFFALKGMRFDGHSFIQDLIEKGVRCFIVNRNFELPELKSLSFIRVDDPLAALQKLAKHHREQFDTTVIGITGSNGKTIVKEWLYHILKDNFNIVRSPRSYNSQIGVPLSVWQMKKEHNLAIFEAGISEEGEMNRLQEIIQPCIGIFTNLGSAHDIGFINEQHKLTEKSILFKDADFLVYASEYREADSYFTSNLDLIKIRWGEGEQFKLNIESIISSEDNTIIIASWDGEEYNIEIPFNDKASIENAIHCWVISFMMKVDQLKVKEAMKHLPSLSNRLEMKAGINGCTLIDDSYSNDFQSLEIALDFLNRQNKKDTRTVILSGFEGESERSNIKEQLAELFESYNISRLITVGAMFEELEFPKIECIHYPSTNVLIANISKLHFRNEAILIKGARSYAFEKIGVELSRQSHQTILEIDLQAMAFNYQQYKSRLKPGTKIMAMVKAFAYGSGITEVAGLIEDLKANYLTVAYPDEGVVLREAGIKTPIMVMNSASGDCERMVQFSLEPEIYSIELLKTWAEFLEHKPLQHYPIHLKIDTGMNRLGFKFDDMDVLFEVLKDAVPWVKIASVFSHLASSDNLQHRDFVLKQIERFKKAVAIIDFHFEEGTLKHILNSSGVAQYPEAQMDMVRLGIGMYGVDPSKKIPLQQVLTLKSFISQIKTIQEGETVGYGRSWVAKQETKVAIIGIGYGDGYSRSFSNGKGKVYINGSMAKVIGNVCMDMTMVDVTSIEGVEEGMEVVIFGASPAPDVNDLAKAIDTIAYEVMTGISGRIKRVFISE